VSAGWLIVGLVEEAEAGSGIYPNSGWKGDVRRYSLVRSSFNFVANEVNEVCPSSERREERFLRNRRHATITDRHYLACQLDLL
jgi:hypothetical protein